MSEVQPRKSPGAAADKAAILHERAKLLAREPRTRERSHAGAAVVEFMLAGERYAFESAWVREVFPLRDLTPLPCTPAFVLGIVNVRGQILAVVDIRRFFDLPFPGLSDLNKVIFLQGHGMEIGVLADVILGVRTVLLEELQPPLPTLAGVQAEYLRGITSDRLAVLDAGRILGDPRLLVNEQVEA